MRKIAAVAFAALLAWAALLIAGMFRDGCGKRPKALGSEWDASGDISGSAVFPICWCGGVGGVRCGVEEPRPRADYHRCKVEVLEDAGLYEYVDAAGLDLIYDAYVMVDASTISFIGRPAWQPTYDITVTDDNGHYLIRDLGGADRVCDVACLPGGGGYTGPHVRGRVVDCLRGCMAEAGVATP